MLLTFLSIASIFSATVSAFAFNVNATRSSAPLGTGTATATANLTGATISPGVISPQYVLKGFEGCEAKEGMDPQWIKDGFSDMITMIQGTTLGYYPTINWNGGAAQDYWGPYSRNSDLRTAIVDNLNRAASVSYQYWLNPFAPRLHVRCDDPKKRCPCEPGKGRTVAYTINHEPHINFCPPYFSRAPLATAVARQNPAREGYISFYVNRAQTWMHELMHIREIGHPVDANYLPGIKDRPVQGWPGISYSPSAPRGSNTYSYGDWFTKWLAQSSGNTPNEMANNADNYALFILANYVQSVRGWYPSKRQVPISPTTKDGYSVAGVNGTSGNATSVDASTIWGDSPFDFDNYCYSSPDD